MIIVSSILLCLLDNLEHKTEVIISLSCRPLDYLLTNWFAYLYGQIQSLRPDVMPDHREGVMRATGFGFARIDMQAS